MSSEEDDARGSSPRKGVCTEETRERRRTRSSFPLTDLKLCIFCQKSKPDPANRRKKERLVRCEGDTTPVTLLNAAQVRCDERVLLEIDQQDLRAKDVLYYRSCYGTYINPRSLQLLVKAGRGRRQGTGRCWGTGMEDVCGIRHHNDYRSTQDDHQHQHPVHQVCGMPEC